MNPHRRTLNQHRLRRLALWMLAVLVWIDAAVFDDRAVSWRHVSRRGDLMSLPWLTQLVGKLLITRAAQLARLRRRNILCWRHGRALHRAHLLRSALGSRLRRTLRHKDVRTWIANLIAVLRNLDACAAPLARRLRHGLTRLWRALAAIAPDAALRGSPASRPALSDSS